MVGRWNTPPQNSQKNDVWKAILFFWEADFFRGYVTLWKTSGGYKVMYLLVCLAIFSWGKVVSFRECNIKISPLKQPWCGHRWCEQGVSQIRLINQKAEQCTKWYPTKYKWSYYVTLINGPWNLYFGVITPISGVKTTPLITGFPRPVLYSNLSLAKLLFKTLLNLRNLDFLLCAGNLMS